MYLCISYFRWKLEQCLWFCWVTLYSLCDSLSKFYQEPCNYFLFFAVASIRLSSHYFIIRGIIYFTGCLDGSVRVILFVLAFQVEDEKLHGLYVKKLVRSFCRSPDENQGISISLMLDVRLFMISHFNQGPREHVMIQNILDS